MIIRVRGFEPDRFGNGGGGFVLARAAEEISLGDVLAAGDYHPVANDRCAFGWGTCDSRHPCPLHGSFSQLKDGVQRWAQAFTLADVRNYAAEQPSLPPRAIRGGLRVRRDPPEE